MTNHDDLEHESGLRPLGEYRDHCARCRQTFDLRERQAACPHESVTGIKTWAGETIHQVCSDCGCLLDGRHDGRQLAD